MTAPEFSRRIAVKRIPSSGLEQSVQASPAECRALAERLQLPAVISLHCYFLLHAHERHAERIVADGALRAEVTQTCVVSLEPFETVVQERFTLVFVAPPEGPAAGPAVDVDPDAPDEVFFEGDAIDLGEAAVEQLALALDPYPRLPSLPEAGQQRVPVDAIEADEPEAEDAPADPVTPFAALARLRRSSGDA